MYKHTFKNIRTVSSRTQKGFTIVELLIVIVVIGILAAITIVSFNGVQSRAKNTAKVSELRSWQKLFEMYKADKGTYPVMANGSYHCLGDFSAFGNKCGAYAATSGTQTYTVADSQPLMTELLTVGVLPTGARTVVNGSVGPFAEYSGGGSSIFLTGVFNGNTGECPSGFEQDYADGAGRLFCKIRLTR